MSALPAGTVTFLLTDVEGSTAAWESDPDKMARAVAELDELVGEVVGRHRGTVVKPRGEGDSHFCVFERATDAVAAGLDLLVDLVARPLSVRASIHTGEVELRDGDYYGRTVNRAARLRSAGHGGQLLLSEATAGLTRAELPEGVSLRDVGSHRLKDLSSPENIFQVVHPDLPDVRVELDTLDQVRSNLPYQVTPLIGREDELAAVGALVRSHRLVTLVALGGSGKTRLALQAAADNSDSFRSGVRLADLAAVSDPAHLADTILAALGAPPSSSDPIGEAIDWIGARPILLVLDNCEHLREPVARAVARLLSGCPALAILATSRQPLEVVSEQVFRVPSLEVPEASEDLGVLAQVPAMRLFLDRAQQADPGFELQPSNVEALVGICRRLDGLPLALELAAARVKALEPSRILERLDRQMTRVSPRPSGDANRTVASAIAWSYEQLSREAAGLLRRISILEGPRDLDCIERISGLDEDDVTDALSELIDNSLLVFAAGPAGGRYRLLELVRSYASSQLDDLGERQDAERARAEWLLWYTSQAGEEETWGSDPIIKGVPELKEEFGPALDWARKNDSERWLGLAAGIGLALHASGFPSAALPLVRQALSASDGSDAHLRARLLRTAADAAHNSGEFHDATAFAEELLELSSQTGASDLKEAHNGIGISAGRLGDLDKASHHLEEVYRLSENSGDWKMAALAANNLGIYSADTAGAMHWFGVQLQIERAHGFGGDALARMGETAHFDSQFDEAVAYFERAVLEPHRFTLAFTEARWGRSELARGRLDDAELHFRKALASNPIRAHAGIAQLGLAAVAHRRGDLTACHQYIEDFLLQLGHEPTSVAWGLLSYGGEAERLGHHDFEHTLARHHVDWARRDAPAKHLAVALHYLAHSEHHLGMSSALQTARRALTALTEAGDGDIVGTSMEEYRKAAEDFIRYLESLPTASPPTDK